MDEPSLPLHQASHRSWKGIEDARHVVEQKLNAKINGQNKNMIHQTLLCGNGSPITEEETPEQTIAGREMPKPSLPAEEQKQQMNEDRQRDISSCPYKEGRDDWEMNILPFPKERIQTNKKPSIDFSSCCSQETRETEFPAVNRTMTGNLGQRASKPPGVDSRQLLGKEAQFGNETEGKVDGELYLPCPKCKESETDGSLLSTEDPTNPNLSRHHSQPESHEDLCLPAGKNNKPYTYIEDFLSERALVSIDSVQTFVDLETGTVQTNVEVSEEGEGVVVKHEVEWVTQLK